MTRLSLRILQFGAIAVVLAVSTLTLFDLDRFFVPKELVLHVVAALAGVFAVRAIARGSFTRVDFWLACFLGWSALSALFATNRWLGFRALAISASGVLIFWTARALREAGLARPLLGALALAVAVAALTSLLQAYGLDTHFFADTRIPGGTLGNRNFIAHAAAFGLPLLLVAAITAGHRRMRIVGALGVMMVVATLVLTRSRAGWLAFGAVVVVTFVAMIASPPLRRDGTTWRRLLKIAAVTACGVAAALFLPNALHWRTDNPYAQTMKHMTDYESGSGRGRLAQYVQSLKMSLRHPFFGVGPGNWAVVYPDPKHVPRNDPSLSDSEPGTTSNPWPSSDWIACISERGLAATVLLALAFLAIAFGAFQQLVRATTAEEGLLAAALLGTLAGGGIAGLFDAVLLLAAPTLLIWAALGVLWTPPPQPSVVPMRGLVLATVVILAALGAVHSAMKLTGMEISGTHGDRASLLRAAHFDPGNYRTQLRLGRMGGRAQRCEHARAARDLYPHAQAAIDAARGCGR